MKHTSLLVVFAAAASFATGPFLHAQTAGLLRKSPGKPSIPVRSVEAASSLKKMDEVEIRAGSLETCVTELKKQLASQKLPPMNIIFGEGTGDLIVPDLQLRAVSGSDALRLLCTAVRCEMDPIFGGGETPEGRAAEYVIGYEIKATQTRPQGVSRSPYMRMECPAMPNPRAALPTGTSSIKQPTPTRLASRPAKVAKPVTSAGSFKSSLFGRLPVAQKPTFSHNVTTSKPPVSDSGMDDISSTSANVITYGHLPGRSQKPTIRIYPLGRITTTVKFPEVEETLMEILQGSGHKPDDAKVSLHEKTNVLVVRGTDGIQQLVTELLESLEKNQADNETSSIAKAERRESEMISEMKLLQHRYERQIQDLERARAEAQAEARDVQKRLNMLQDQINLKK